MSDEQKINPEDYNQNLFYKSFFTGEIYKRPNNNPRSNDNEEIKNEITKPAKITVDRAKKDNWDKANIVSAILMFFFTAALFTQTCKSNQMLAKQTEANIKALKFSEKSFAKQNASCLVFQIDTMIFRKDHKQVFFRFRVFNLSKNLAKILGWSLSVQSNEGWPIPDKESVKPGILRYVSEGNPISISIGINLLDYPEYFIQDVMHGKQSIFLYAYIKYEDVITGSTRAYKFKMSCKIDELNVMNTQFISNENIDELILTDPETDINE